jgi:hypothetical protein
MNNLREFIRGRYPVQTYTKYFIYFALLQASNNEIFRQTSLQILFIPTGLALYFGIAFYTWRSYFKLGKWPYTIILSSATVYLFMYNLAGKRLLLTDDED